VESECGELPWMLALIRFLFRRLLESTPLQRESLETETTTQTLGQVGTRHIIESFSYEDFDLRQEIYATEADLFFIDPFTTLPSDPTSAAAATSPSANVSAFMPSAIAFDVAARPASESWSRFIKAFPLLRESLLAEVSEFFAQSWVTYPVLHWETVIEKIQNEVYLSDPEFCILLVSIRMLNEACKLRVSPDYGSSTLSVLTKDVEDMRRSSDDYDFANTSSIDTVVVSLFLFTAYSVCDKHNRAFCYLTEAIGLMDMIMEPSAPTEIIRFQRLEHVLFVTESASVSIYGSGRKRKLARRPSAITTPEHTLMWYNDGNSAEERNWIRDAERMKADEEAVKLLLLMTQLHLANEITEVANVSVDNMMTANIAQSFHNPSHHQPLPLSTQTADVAITRQWKLASQWWRVLSMGNHLPSSTDSLQVTIQILGMSTLQWSKTLEPGQLRIVGLGKVVALADNILNISTKLGNIESCTNILGDLIHTVLAIDYERYFAPQLSIIELCMAHVPRPITPNDDFERLFLEL
jgi:hypothetical protein